MKTLLFITYQPVGEDAWTTERDGTAVFQDGLCIEIIEEGRYAWSQNSTSRYTIDGVGYGFDLTTKKMLDILYW